MFTIIVNAGSESQPALLQLWDTQITTVGAVTQSRQTPEKPWSVASLHGLCLRSLHVGCR